jgi:hypothetical protein
MLLPKQRKIKNSFSQRDPGVHLSNKLVGLFTLLLLAGFVIYIQVFHAALHYKSVPVVPVVLKVNNGAAAILPEHANTIIKAPVPPITKKVRERHVEVETKTATSGKDTIILTTSEGSIKIVLRPDLSKESSDYIHAMAADASHCSPCNLYRAEKVRGNIASLTFEFNNDLSVSLLVLSL